MKVSGNKQVDRKELRQFGIGLAILAGLVGGLLLWNGRGAGILVLTAGLLLALAFWLDAPGARFGYKSWLQLAEVMNRFVIRVLLTLLYFLLLTPIALLGRLCGQTFIMRDFRGGCKSYWTPHVGSCDRLNSEKQS